MHQSILPYLFLGFISVYIGILVILSLSQDFTSNEHRELPSLDPKSDYKFRNPDLAYDVLSQLEVIPELGNFKSTPIPSKPFTNLKVDDNYCEKRRAYFVLYPEEIFEKMAFMSDIHPLTLSRKKMLTPLGVDVHPHIGAHMAESDKTMYNIDISVTNFYSRMVFFGSHKIGRHFSCLSQVSNHVPGNLYMLGRKFAVTEAAKKYAQVYKEKPECFNLDKFMPKTYLLYQKDDCERFFKVINSPLYQAQKKDQTIVFLKKAGEAVHMGAGVDPLDEGQEADLRKTYENGAKCGAIDTLTLVQKYIPNPLLIEGRKFDFRFYFMIASMNPLIAYYHDGFLRVSLVSYDVKSGDKKSLLTNLALSEGIYGNVRKGELFQGMNEEELKHAQQWTLTRLQSYLLESGVISDSNWLENYLRPQFKKAMIHLLRLGFITPVKSSSVYDLYGVDFMLDTDMNLWFIEANSAPGLDGYSKELEKFIVKMLKDEVEIVMGLLRSRMKRVIIFVNELIESGSVIQDENGGINIKSLGLNRLMFEKITENYFEEEFMPSPENGFSKIIDENYKGTERYMGFINEQCL